MPYTREYRRKARHEGGPDYRDVAARRNNLFVGKTRVGALNRLLHAPDGYWIDGDLDTERDLKLSGNARLHHCGCGAWFIDHWAAKTCLACRKAAMLDRARAYTAERSADRAEARKNRAAHCAKCGEPMPVERSTRRYCSPTCRQAAYRERVA